MSCLCFPVDCGATQLNNTDMQLHVAVISMLHRPILALSSLIPCNFPSLSHWSLSYLRLSISVKICFYFSTRRQLCNKLHFLRSFSSPIRSSAALSSLPLDQQYERICDGVLGFLRESSADDNLQGLLSLRWVPLFLSVYPPVLTVLLRATRARHRLLSLRLSASVLSAVGCAAAKQLLLHRLSSLYSPPAPCRVSPPLTNVRFKLHSRHVLVHIVLVPAPVCVYLCMDVLMRGR